MTLNCIGCSVPTISDQPWCERCDKIRQKLIEIIDGSSNLETYQTVEHIMDQLKCRSKEVTTKDKIFHLVWKKFDELTTVTEQNNANSVKDLVEVFAQIKILNEIIKEAES